jgi:hypothetical protein
MILSKVRDNNSSPLTPVHMYTWGLFIRACNFVDFILSWWIVFWVFPRRLSIKSWRFGTLCRFHLQQVVKMEPTQSSEMSAFNTQMPGKYPEDNSSLLQHGESLKSRTYCLIIIYTTMHCSLESYCAIWVRHSNFRHQASPHVSPRESTQWRRWNCGWEMSGNFA